MSHIFGRLRLLLLSSLLPLATAGAGPAPLAPPGATPIAMPPPIAGPALPGAGAPGTGAWGTGASGTGASGAGSLGSGGLGSGAFASGSSGRPMPAAVPPAAVLPVPNGLVVEAGSGKVIVLGGPATSVFAADPKVAEVRPASATSLFIFGVAPGRTTVAALNAAGAPIAQYEVTVRPSGYGAAEARAAIGRALPGRSITIETLDNGLSVAGEVRSPAEADQIMQLARSYVTEKQTVENRLSVMSSLQVNLSVRVAEMSRNLSRKLGVNWQMLGTIGSIATLPALNVAVNAATAVPCLGLQLSISCQGLSFNGLIDALAQDQLVRVLAEPNLTAISGETASFLVGGEFPIPVAQQNNEVTIEFKQYGISLAFVPTVFTGGRISIKVRPEVSELSDQGAITMQAGNSTIQVPALTVRRAETTVELGSGQSFAIAGLLLDSAKLTANYLPILGDLPILGPLFRDDQFQNNETELVIVITPYLVRPTSDPAALHVPGQSWTPPNDLERILLLRQTGRPSAGPGPATPIAARIPGDAGFVVQ